MKKTIAAATVMALVCSPQEEIQETTKPSVEDVIALSEMLVSEFQQACLRTIDPTEDLAVLEEETIERQPLPGVDIGITKENVWQQPNDSLALLNNRQIDICACNTQGKCWHQMEFENSDAGLIARVERSVELGRHQQEVELRSEGYGIDFPDNFLIRIMMIIDKMKRTCVVDSYRSGGFGPFQGETRGQQMPITACEGIAAKAFAAQETVRTQLRQQLPRR